MRRSASEKSKGQAEANRLAWIEFRLREGKLIANHQSLRQRVGRGGFSPSWRGCQAAGFNSGMSFSFRAGRRDFERGGHSWTGCPHLESRLGGPFSRRPSSLFRPEFRQAFRFLELRGVVRIVQKKRQENSSFPEPARVFRRKSGRSGCTWLATNSICRST